MGASRSASVSDRPCRTSAAAVFSAAGRIPGLPARTQSAIPGHGQRTGARLALLSNAPEPLARAIDQHPWSRHFDHRYYSCRLGAAKPAPEAFQLVLGGLGERPDAVLF